jgi:hypothetical protein
MKRKWIRYSLGERSSQDTRPFSGGASSSNGYARSFSGEGEDRSRMTIPYWNMLWVSNETESKSTSEEP